MKWITANANGIVIGILTGIIVAIIAYCFKNIISYWKSRNSAYNGTWEQLIYENDDVNYQGEIIKRDIYQIKHIRYKHTEKLVVNMTGTIKRVYPIVQNARIWDFFGYLDGDVLTVIYQSQEGQKSRGCIYLKLVSDLKFQGYYLEEHRDGMIDKTPLILKKLK
jgi:hypothetical protein